MKTHVQRVFRDLERDTERISAYLRLLVVVALGGLLVTSDSADPHDVMVFGLGVYAAVAFLALGFAYLKFFRPWLPWLFVTLDVGVLWLLMFVPARSMGMATIAILALPAASLAFVFLAHAAMRYRPGLVIYAAVLFVIAWLVALVVVDIEPRTMGWPHGPMGQWAASATPWHAQAQEIIRALVIVLTALILSVTVVRTKKHVFRSIIEARRAANLSRFMPEALVEKLAHEGVDSVLGSHRQDAAVMFTDIRGFTTMSERTEPNELGRFLGEFRSRLSAPIAARHGIIDKFIGDAIMALFGVPEPRADDARNALNCAFDMLTALDRWNAERHKEGLSHVSIGIGIHYGPVLAGALGDESRLEYTVIGDSVNIAERLEKLTRTFDTELVVSADVLEATGAEPVSEDWERLPLQTVKGRSGQIVAYRLRQRAAATAAAADAVSREARG